MAKLEVEAIKPLIKPKIMIELAWEVCNQVGGIYTVIRSKVPAMVDKWGEDYFLIGPYFAQTASIEFEPILHDTTPLFKAVQHLQKMGLEVHYGYWLVTGKPRVVLLDFKSMLKNIDALKYDLWERRQVSTLNVDELINQVVALGEMIRLLLNELAKITTEKLDVTAHFHEWMASSTLPDIRKESPKIATVFTTHATMLGRYMAPNVPDFYNRLGKNEFNWLAEAQHYGIETQATLERQAAREAHVLTTVSDVTARECTEYFDRQPDLILPNGLNVTRFTALHEFQNLHAQYKEKINQFVMGHFFQSYSFDLDKTLYFFTSGRYEFINKGYDLTLEALSRLNFKMVQAKMETTIVMFIITKNPVHSIDASVLQSRAMMEEIHDNCRSIEKQVGEKLFQAAAAGKEFKIPDLNNFLDEYWQLRLRRTVQAWKTKQLPKTVTHWLKEEDDIVRFLKRTNLQNHEQDRVKVIYHPDFIAPSNPLFGIEYNQFVRGCHLGIFPSYYEPWGYTPLECVVRGVPTVTSDLSGFGDYMKQIMQDFENWGVYVIDRSSKDFNQAAEQLAELLFKFVKLSRRERITQRNRVESISETFDWMNLRSYYDTAHELALKKRK